MSTADLIKRACQLALPVTMNNAEMGGVSCVLITENNTIFEGVCIDTISGMGFCAEHTAISQMITQQEYRVRKIIAVKNDGDGSFSILSPCGRCREFLYQINNENLSTEVVLGTQMMKPLRELLPYYDWSERVD